MSNRNLVVQLQQKNARNTHKHTHTHTHTHIFSPFREADKLRAGSVPDLPWKGKSVCVCVFEWDVEFKVRESEREGGEGLLLAQTTPPHQSLLPLADVRNAPRSFAYSACSGRPYGKMQLQELLWKKGDCEFEHKVVWEHLNRIKHTHTHTRGTEACIARTPSRGWAVDHSCITITAKRWVQTHADDIWRIVDCHSPLISVCVCVWSALNWEETGKMCVCDKKCCFKPKCLIIDIRFGWNGDSWALMNKAEKHWKFPAGEKEKDLPRSACVWELV